MAIPPGSVSLEQKAALIAAARATGQLKSMFTSTNAEFGCTQQPNSMFKRINIEFGCDFQPNCLFKLINIEFGWSAFGREELPRTADDAVRLCRDMTSTRPGSSSRRHGEPLDRQRHRRGDRVDAQGLYRVSAVALPVRAAARWVRAFKRANEPRVERAAPACLHRPPNRPHPRPRNQTHPPKPIPLQRGLRPRALNRRRGRGIGLWRPSASPSASLTGGLPLRAEEISRLGSGAWCPRSDRGGAAGRSRDARCGLWSSSRHPASHQRPFRLTLPKDTAQF